MDGSGSGLIWDTVGTFAWRGLKKPKKNLIVDSSWWRFNLGPSVFKATVLHIQLQCLSSHQGLPGAFVASNQSQKNMLPIARLVLCQH
jgi:hypothetical protein